MHSMSDKKTMHAADCGRDSWLGSQIRSFLSGHTGGVTFPRTPCCKAEPRG